MSLPPETIVHGAGQYTQSVISAKAAVMIEAEAELKEINWKEAFPVRREATGVAKRLPSNAIPTSRMKQTFYDTCSAKKRAARDRLFRSFGVHGLLSKYKPRGPEEMEKRCQELEKVQ